MPEAGYIFCDLIKGWRESLRESFRTSKSGLKLGLKLSNWITATSAASADNSICVL